jgi:hypothetical protein
MPGTATDPMPADVLAILQAYSENCREELACTAPQEIDRAQWVEALEILPPDCWERRGPFESFQCCERFRGRITSTYLRRGMRYWTFRGPHGMGIEAIIETVRRHLAANHREIA